MKSKRGLRHWPSVFKCWVEKEVPPEAIETRTEGQEENQEGFISGKPRKTSNTTKTQPKKVM